VSQRGGHDGLSRYRDRLVQITHPAGGQVALMQPQPSRGEKVSNSLRPGERVVEVTGLPGVAGPLMQRADRRYLGVKLSGGHPTGIGIMSNVIDLRISRLEPEAPNIPA